MRKNVGRQARIRFTLLMIVSMGAVAYSMSQLRASYEDYLALFLFFASVLAGGTFGVTIGLLISLVAVLLFGSHYFYESFVRKFSTDISLDQGIWLLIIPLGAVAAGFMGDAMIFMDKLFRKFRIQIESLLLTGQLGIVGNEVTFQQGLKEECARARRALSQFTVLFLDADNLDDLRKMLGADTPEQVGTRISEAISRNTRDIDKKARLDETLHALILPDCPKSSYGIVLDRIQKALVKADFNYHGRILRGDVNLRAGTAFYPENGDSPEKLIEAVRKDLERHKQ